MSVLLLILLASAAPASSLLLRSSGTQCPSLVAAHIASARRAVAPRLSEPAAAPAPLPPGVRSAALSPPVAEQLRLFWRLATPYFMYAEGAKLGAALLIALTLANSGISVLFSYTSRDFWTALSSKDAEHFYELTARFAGALALATPVSVLYKYQRNRLTLSWREWCSARLARATRHQPGTLRPRSTRSPPAADPPRMTKQLTELYYENEAYYRLELSSEIDNPDQRIAEDVSSFTSHQLVERGTCPLRKQRPVAPHELPGD